MRGVVIGIAAAVLAAGILLTIAHRRATPPATLRERLNKAGLRACTIGGHPSRLDVTFVYCPGPEQALKVQATLAHAPGIIECTILRAERRTVMVTTA